MNARSHGSLLSYAWDSLGRRRGKTIGLVGALATAFALLSAVLFATGALRAEAERSEETAPDLVVQQLLGGRPSLIAPELASFISKLPSVRSVAPRVWGYVFIPSLQANVTVVGRTRAKPDLSQIAGALDSGRDIGPGERQVALLGDSLARLLRVHEGDVIAMPSPREDAPSLTVVGTFGSSVGLYASDVLLVDPADARVILDYPDDRATDLAIELHNPAEATVIARAITERAKGTRVIEKRLLARTYRLTYGRRAGIVLAAALPALFAMLILAWDRIAGLGAAERREIAVQKAVGWATADVLYAKLYESVLMGVAAAMLGGLSAYAWVFVAGAPGLREALAGWSVLYPATRLTPAIDPAEWFGLMCVTIGPFVGISIVPAWRAATIDPMDALRT